MAERATLNQVVQIGVEATPGTAVVATKKLQTVSIEPGPSVDVDVFRPSGQKYNALAALSREWVEADVSGRGSYTELIYLLSSVVDTAVITTPDPTGAPTARKWSFISDSTGDDAPKTFTVEHGSGVRADRFTYGIVNEFGMGFSRDSIEISGSMLGRKIEDPFTLTATGVTTVALQPILPTQVSVYMDPSSATLGTTKLTRVLNAEFNLGGRYGPVWVLDAANPGFVATVETEPDLTLNLTMEADSTGMDQLVRLRAGDTRFVRIEAIGATIAGTTKYQFTLDMAVKVSDTGGFSDEDGVYAVEWNFVGVHDGDWGKAFDIALINELSVL